MAKVVPLYPEPLTRVQRFKKSVMFIHENCSTFEIKAELIHTISQTDYKTPGSPDRKFLDRCFDKTVFDILKENNTPTLWKEFSEIMKCKTELLEIMDRVYKDMDNMHQNDNPKNEVKDDIELLRNEVNDSFAQAKKDLFQKKENIKDGIILATVLQGIIQPLIDVFCLIEKSDRKDSLKNT